jgi:hypothetical protein
MKKYEQLENKIQELQAEVERLKQEEKAEQIDLSTCIAGQLVQYRNGNFDYYEYKDEAGGYHIGGDRYDKDGRFYGNHTETQYDVVKVFPAKIPVPGRFNVFYAKKVLEGDISCLGNSFDFADTPQGVQYWRDIFITGKTNLSFGDMILIQKWVIQALS